MKEIKSLIGFLNIGNICYISSILQCFVYNHDFIEFILSIENEEDLFIKELIKIVKHTHIESEENKFIILNLLTFIKLFMKEKPSFKCFDQNDSHEFLMFFMDLIYEKTKSINSTFKKLYYGEIKSTVICSNCNSSSHTLNEFNTINLSITNISNIHDFSKNNLIDMFCEYLKEESYDGFYCEKCKDKYKCVKKYSINKLPDNLIIVFNRYSPHGHKYNNLISFPFENLKIKEKINNEIISYNLNGIVNHFGMHSQAGHYTSMNKINNNWFHMNDSNITLINDFNAFKSCYSYILFYSKSIKEIN
jgi:ubiquitin C-terminal hydrolase